MINKSTVHTLLPFFVLLLLFSYVNAQVLNEKVSIRVDNVLIEKVLGQLHIEYNIPFYNYSQLLPVDTVSLHVENRSVEYILNKLLSQHQIAYNEVAGKIMLYPALNIPDDELLIKPLPKVVTQRVAYREIVRYVYDSVQKMVIDTIVTYKRSVALANTIGDVNDTIYTFSYSGYTAGIRSLCFTITPLFYSANIAKKNNTLDAQNIQQQVNRSQWMQMDVSASYAWENRCFSIGSGVSVVHENVAYLVPYDSYIDSDVLGESDDSVVEHVAVKYVVFEYDIVTPETNLLVHVKDSVEQLVTEYKIVPKTETVSGVDTASVFYQGEYSAVAYYFTMPIRFGYSFRFSRLISFEINANIGAHVLLYSSVSQHARSFVTHVPYKRIAFTSAISAGFVYDIFENVSLWGGANVQADIVSRYKSQYFLDRQKVYFGLSVGFKYHL